MFNGIISRALAENGSHFGVIELEILLVITMLRLRDWRSEYLEAWIRGQKSCHEALLVLDGFPVDHLEQRTVAA
jgi:hypothetical protein